MKIDFNQCAACKEPFTGQAKHTASVANGNSLEVFCLCGDCLMHMITDGYKLKRFTIDEHESL